MRRALAAAAVATAAALTLAGCAGTDEPSAGGDGTPAASTPSEPSGGSTDEPSGESTDEGDDSGTVIEIAIHGDEVEPQGRSVEVAAGEPITLKVTADRPGELHVHSSPEQELEVEKGESTLSLTLDKPGVVDVEEHESGVVVLRLEVR